MSLKKIFSTKMVLLVLLLLAAGVAMPASGTDELIAIPEPINSNEVHLGGITVEIIDDIIDRTSSSTLLTQIEIDERISALTSIKAVFPDVTEDDMSLVRLAMSDILKGIDQSDTSNPSITPYWGGFNPEHGIIQGGPHNEFAKYACLFAGASEINADIAGTYGKEPDTWGGGSHTVFHYADEGAPELAKLYAIDAINYLAQSQTNAGYQRLAHSLHMIADMSQPYHTSSYWQNFPRHILYEEYLNYNWRENMTYQSILENDPYYYFVTDVQVSTENLATSVNPYLNTIDYIMGTNPDTWHSNSQLISITNNCIREGIRYCRGTAVYVLNY